MSQRQCVVFLCAVFCWCFQLDNLPAPPLLLLLLLIKAGQIWVM